MKKNKKTSNDSIKCNVESCKHNNCDEGTCTLEEIEISCTCDNCDCSNEDETICRSFENDESESDDDNEQEEYEEESEA